jgi:hypothetical protein
MRGLTKILAVLSMIASCALGHSALARDELVTSVRTSAGETIPFVLTSNGTPPTYAVILMPGGAGRLNLPTQGSQSTLGDGNNFLIRSRNLFASGPFVAISTDNTSTLERMMGIIKDVEGRYPGIKIYLVGTSRSTESTMALATPLDGRVAGFVHTSSMGSIGTFDTRPFKSRHLIVLHAMDGCKSTKPSNGMAAHRKYGTDLIVMEGGYSNGDECEPAAHHGYAGVEKETVDKIKAWILAGR